MTAPAENPHAEARHSGGLAHIVRWLTEERPLISGDDAGQVAGAPRRVARWTYGETPRRPAKPDAEPEVLREVRIGPAPRCAVAGETIALSVSLINTRGDIYLGWPVKLEWSTSDPAIATVNEFGIVDVHARGRVELTCTCEGITGSVQLTVVEPAVAAAVGLPVPARLRAVSPEPVATRPLPEPPPPAHRRSVERGSVRHRPVVAVLHSRGMRRFVFRTTVAAATVGVLAIVLTRNPEDSLVVIAQPTDATAAEPGRSGAQPLTPTRVSTLANAVIPTNVPPLATTLPTEDSARGESAAATRVVSEAAGTAVVASPQPTAGATAAVTATAPALSRVVVASPASPSQLAEGESVRLSAAGVDERGESVADRRVTWRSENEDVAVVDANGVVTARRPGTVTIVAESEGRSGRVTLSVGARRVADAPPAAAATQTPTTASRENEPAPAAPRERASTAAAQVMRARVAEFMQALQERNGGRLAELYAPESGQDRKNLQALLDRVRRAEARLKTSEAQVGSPEVRDMEATIEFTVPMSWTTPFGRVRNQTSTFRAVLEPSDGGWRLVGIRATGRIE